MKSEDFEIGKNEPMYAVLFGTSFAKITVIKSLTQEIDKKKLDFGRLS
jgi:hypothetical protein